jgi:frataxin-like iron-binding protein CyaY
MNTTETDFPVAAAAALEALHERLVRATDDFDFDVDYHEGALVVEFEGPRERFIASPNTHSRQIWVSAHARSFKFSQTATGFVLPSGQSLDDMMADAIRRRIRNFAY